jgi:hypothetical protein
MPTFTFITEFRGGTYISQQKAEDVLEACLLWRKDLAEGGYVAHLDVSAFNRTFERDFAEFPPLPIDTVDNVWVFHLPMGRYTLDAHVVQTDMAPVLQAAGA